jgi:hypothetical protein
MATVEVDVRERAEAILRERRLQFRARVALERAGWDAKPRRTRAAIRVDAQVRKDEREAVFVRALAAQEHDKRRGRRLSPEEIQRAMAARQQLKAEKVALIKTYVGERRKANPTVKAKELLAEVNRVYEVEISEGNFYVTYFTPAAPTTNGGRPRAPVAIAAPVEADAPVPAAPAPEMEAPAHEMAASAPAPAAPEPRAFHFDRAIGWTLEYREAHPKAGLYNGWTEYRKVFGDGMDETTYRRRVWRHSDPKKVPTLPVVEEPAPPLAAAGQLPDAPLPMEQVLAGRAAAGPSDIETWLEPGNFAAAIADAVARPPEAELAGNVDTVPPLEAVTIQPPEAPAAAPATEPEPSPAVRTRIDFTTPRGSLRGEQAEDGRWSLALELFSAENDLVGEIVDSMLGRRVAA